MNNDSNLEQLDYDNLNSNDILWNFLFIYLPPIILFQGIIGNVLSLIVFFRLGKLRNKFKPDFLLKTFKYLSNRCIKKSEKTLKIVAVGGANSLATPSPGGLTIYLYLSLLALFDLGVLIFGLLNEWIYSLTLFDLKNESDFVCKLFTFFAYLFSHLSSCTIVIATFIRLLAVYKPYKATNLTNLKMVKLISFLQLLILSVFNSHLFWNMNLIQLDYKNNNSTSNLFNDEQEYSIIISNLSDLIIQKNVIYSNKQCKIKQNSFALSIWPIIDKLVYSILPFLLIFMFNILILINISKVQKYKYTLYVSKLKQDLLINKENLIPKQQVLEVVAIASVNQSSNTYQIKKLNEYNLDIKDKIIHFKKYHLVGKKFTVVLLAISFSFLILTLPAVFTYILIEPLTKKFEKMEINEANLNFEMFGYIQKTTDLLMYLNHSINFFIYFITSFRFRQQFKQLIHYSVFKKNFIIYCQCYSNNKKNHLYD
jgi:hypothetical protein